MHKPAGNCNALQQVIENLHKVQVSPQDPKCTASTISFSYQLDKRPGCCLAGSLLRALHACCVLVTFKLLFRYFVAPQDDKVLPWLGQGVTLCVAQR